MIHSQSHKYLQHINHISPKVMDRLTNRVLKRPVPSSNTCRRLATIEAEIFAPHVDVTRSKVAFGQLAIPQLRRQLRDRDPLIVKQALCSLLDMSHDPEKAVQIVSLNVIPWLVKLMVSEDDFVRKQTLQLIRVIANQPGGKQAILNISDLVKNISLLMSDMNSKIRLEAVSALEELARGYIGINCLIEAKFIPVIIDCLQKEVEDSVTIELLIVLELLLDQNDGARLQCINNTGCELAVLLENLNPVIRAKTAAILAQLFVHPLGKKQVVEHKADILQMLTLCLDDENEEVKIKATGALMFALTTTPAKNKCLPVNLIPRLLHYTQASNCPDLQRNSIKALTNMAETPSGRARLLKVINFLKHTTVKQENKDIQDHLKVLIDTILWKP